MTDKRPGSTLPAVPSLVAGSLVFAGLLLWMLVGKEWIFVAGLGAFGPGILRELGLLDDHDEFQRQAARRAGYHAYLVGGLVTVALVSLLHFTGRVPRFPAELVTVILLALWMSWLFSALLGYWGAARTTSTVLLIFGTFWLIFVIADVAFESSSAGEVLRGATMGFFIVAPFFLLARTAHLKPKATGAVLILVGALFVLRFGLPRENLALSTTLFTNVVLAVPLLGCGIALLRESGGAGEEEK